MHLQINQQDNETMNAPLTPNMHASIDGQAALPKAWVERIFQKLHGRFGNPFTDKFRAGQLDVNGEDVGIVNAKNVWAEELAGFAPDEIKLALAARYTFPPSLDEFQKAARPQRDLSLAAMMQIAAREMAKRRNHEPQSWPSNRLFWAARRMAYDLTNPELTEKTRLQRFEIAYSDAAKDADKPIPDVSPANALPAPGKTTITRQEAQERADQIGLKLGKLDTTKRWAFDIAAAPEKFPLPSIEAALKALRAFGAEWPAALIERARSLGLSDLVDGVTA